MKATTLSKILATIGFIGGITGYASMLIYMDTSFALVGVLGNAIQLTSTIWMKQC